MSHLPTRFFRPTFLALTLLASAWAVSGCSAGDSLASSQLADQVADREARVADREREVAAREAAILERAQQLASRDTDLAQREQSIAEHQSELAEQETQQQRRAAQLTTRERSLRADEERLEALEASLRERQEQQAATPSRGHEEPQAPREPVRRTPPPVYVDVEVPAGALIDVQFLSTLSSRSSREGDDFRVALDHDLYAEGGDLVAAAGTELTGSVASVTPAKKIGGRASLELHFHELVLASGKTMPLNASLYHQTRNGQRDAATIGGAAAGGAILGRILDDDDRGRGTVLGAILGAAAGTAIAAKRPGEEVTLASGSIVTLRLDEPLIARVPWQSRHSNASP